MSQVGLDIVNENKMNWLQSMDLSFIFNLLIFLYMNTKGIIMRALDQFRLKTCMDFKTFPNGQVVSIGQNCYIIAIVEHELLHALGFWHEQSRYDRDEYVTIVYENILEGYQNNFNKYSENDTTTLGTPYDCYSVMHYSKDAFTNGNGSTIITKQPEFQDVFGQWLKISSNDVLKLN
uniref:Metalloendopeptidase n=1 Tax=Hucho hucho TaxID=62062 RepID=A0A4W5M9I1_9TELE